MILIFCFQISSTFLFSNIVYFFVKIYFLGGSGSGCDVSIALRKAGEKLFKDDKMREGEGKRASTLKQEKECFYEELYHQTGIKKRSSLRVCDLYMWITFYFSIFFLFFFIFFNFFFISFSHEFSSSSFPPSSSLLRLYFVPTSYFHSFRIHHRH